ncbi:MAG: LysR family transcriptional regulator [Rhodospirillales bacterium]|nr:LysR family transcriptional regulator [Rhodospirillales bacterium]MDH3790703.1 LysR family transcriptional regulator [Rhodospirillales bacterium]MDH3910194.1 LysR family transcriptional regulator [Rhodospirillales bacterium]MDH3917517.1 LysR family transcriptional regulator [Rhodospirillales bacterium]MDH3965782.1 LysR family transcriptional regulator [Rhodospirillales bacterium]
MPDLSAMAVFARVVETESFTRAAEELRLSKSAVSKQVSRLEDRLGVRLLNRTTRRLSLTEAGAAFYGGCQKTLSEAEAAEQAVTHLAMAPRGVLRVAAPMSFGFQHVGPALPDFLSACPELTLDLALNDRMVDLVEEGYDVAIRIGVLADSSLVARRLAPSRLVLCAAPGYLAERGRPAAPEDLARHDCASYSYRTAGPEWRFRGPDGLHRVKVSGRLAVNNGDVLLAAALGGLGVVMLPSFIAGGGLRAGGLVRVLPDWRVAEEANVYAVYPASRNLSPKVRVFVDFLAARFGEPPYWDEGIDP